MCCHIVEASCNLKLKQIILVEYGICGRMYDVLCVFVIMMSSRLMSFFVSVPSVIVEECAAILPQHIDIHLKYKKLF